MAPVGTSGDTIELPNQNVAGIRFETAPTQLVAALDVRANPGPPLTDAPALS